jgi:hypothetical protein
VKHGEKDRALDGEAELAPAKLGLDHAADPELAPKSLHYYGRADLRHGPGAESSRLVPLDEPHLEREAREAFHDAVDVAFGLEPVPGASAPDVGPTLRVGEPTERRDDALPDLAALTEGLHDLQVFMIAGRLRADEHGRSFRDTTSIVAARPVSSTISSYQRYTEDSVALHSARFGDPTPPNRPHSPDHGVILLWTVEDERDS